MRYGNSIPPKERSLGPRKTQPDGKKLACWEGTRSTVGGLKVKPQEKTIGDKVVMEIDGWRSQG